MPTIKKNSALSRRLLLQSPAAVLAPAGQLLATPAALPVTFPSQPPDLAREVVSVSHGNVKRVRELVDAHPSLSKAAWDWGFGDWETALGAASHVGNREIAGYLISKGAHPTIFSAAMLGQLEVVKAFVAAQPGVQRIQGPHSISLLAHAKNGGEAAEPVLAYLESLGDAGSTPTVPLKPEEMSQLTGTYSFGSGPNDKVEIAMVRGQLQFTRTGTVARGLVHTGNRVFHPAGASDVRISFGPDGDGMVLTIFDPDVVLTARRG